MTPSSDPQVIPAAAQSLPAEVYVVLDVETLHLATDPGHSWGRVEGLGLAVACTWSKGEGFRDWFAEDAPRLLPYLIAADRVVGHNIERFDLPVLAGALGRPVAEVLATFKGRIIDTWADCRVATGRMLSLDALARGSLGEGKSGNGADAPRLWREGKREEVVAYCRRDVDLTRRVYEHGLAHGSLHAAADVKRGPTSFRVRWSVR